VVHLFSCFFVVVVRYPSLTTASSPLKGLSVHVRFGRHGHTQRRVAARKKVAKQRAAGSRREKKNDLFNVVKKGEKSTLYTNKKKKEALKNKTESNTAKVTAYRTKGETTREVERNTKKSEKKRAPCLKKKWGRIDGNTHTHIRRTKNTNAESAERKLKKKTITQYRKQERRPLRIQESLRGSWGNKHTKKRTKCASQQSWAASTTTFDQEHEDNAQARVLAFYTQYEAWPKKEKEDRSKKAEGRKEPCI
jgi:hypothetical protein